MIKSIGISVLCLLISLPVLAQEPQVSPPSADEQVPGPIITLPPPPISTDPANTSALYPDLMTKGKDAEAPGRSDEYDKPNWADLLRTMVRFNAIDLADDNMIDGFTAVTECDLYRFFFKDDFKWQEVRKSMRKSTEMNMHNFPVHYRYVTAIKLDRYDFDKKLYKFADQNVLRKVNAFRIYSVSGSTCGNQAVEDMPRSFQAVSDAPVNLLGLPLAPTDAQSLLHLMSEDKNLGHVLYIRFDMTVTYIDHMRKLLGAPGTAAAQKRAAYYQASENEPKLVRMDVRLDSVNFYEDPALTKLIYGFKP